MRGDRPEKRLLILEWHSSFESTKGGTKSDFNGLQAKETKRTLAACLLQSI